MTTEQREKQLNIQYLNQSLAESLATLESTENTLLATILAEDKAEFALKQEKNRVILDVYTDKDKLKEYGANESVRDAKLSQHLENLAAVLTDCHTARLHADRTRSAASNQYQHLRDSLRIYELIAKYE